MMKTEQMELKDILADELGLKPPDRKFDDSIGTIIYQVKYGEDWIETTESIFRSWTGLRRINGDDHHGPVYNFGAEAPITPYTGNRTCGCLTCQMHVEAKYKKN